MSFLNDYRKAVTSGTLKPDAVQERAAAKLSALAQALKRYRPGRTLFGGQRRAPRGLYLWGDVGRGKSMLMDLFFAAAPTAKKRRVHFNTFMMEVHQRIHDWRSLTEDERALRPEFVRDAGDDPRLEHSHAN